MSYTSPEPVAPKEEEPLHHGDNSSGKLEAIEQCATFVALNGAETESALKQRFGSQPEYKWLMDGDCMDHRYYKQRVRELRSAKAEAEEEQDEPQTGTHSEDSGGERKKRKSRWGSASETLPLDADLMQYAKQVFGTVHLEEHQWRQLVDQRNIRMLTQMCRKSVKKVREQYEYDSDEEVDGGTWEHKRRMQEMDKTKERAQLVTTMNQGKHHIGHFLPPDKLSRFLQQWNNLKQGKDPDQNLADGEANKIAADNVGFKMMQRMGWTEGQSLGAEGSSGITEPIKW